MALHFNSDSGTDDYLTKSVAIFSGHTYPLTFSAWVRPDDRGSQIAVASGSGSGTSKQISLGCGGSGKFQARMKGGGATSSVLYENSNTTWFHILGSFEASDDVKLYVNGSVDGTNTASNNISDFADSDEFWIGTGVLSGTNITSRTWEGGIAEVAAYAAELTAGEISALADGFSPLLVQPKSLVGYWPLGGPMTSALSGTDALGTHALTVNGGVLEEHHPQAYYPTLSMRSRVSAEPEPTVPGQGHDYALAGDMPDFKVHLQGKNARIPDNKADFGVQHHGN